MTEEIAKILTMRLISYELIEKKNKEMYQYSIQIWLERVIGILAIISLSAIFHVVLETLLFLVFFEKIRKHSGGYHANSFLSCMIGSISLYVGYVKILYPLLRQYIIASDIAVLISGLVIFVIGAVNHPNMGWNDSEFKRTKFCVRMYVILELLFVGLAILVHMKDSYILFMSYGIILSAVLLLLGKLVKQEV